MGRGQAADHDPEPLLDWLGARADRPAIAAATVATTAVVFSAVWFSMGDPGEAPLVVGVLYPVTVANAAVVAYVAWRLLVPDGTWSYRRGLATGVAIGVGSHLTIGYVWLASAMLLDLAVDPGPWPDWSIPETLVAGLLFSIYSVPLTLGIPIALSVGAALGLTYCRRQARPR